MRLIAGFSWFLSVVAVAAGAKDIQTPEVSDPRLELDLIASEPVLVTPIGLAIDASDRVFVLESHTHLPPAHYPGPKSDRIKVFEPAKEDQTPAIFTRGFAKGMNLAFSPDEHLYVVCATEVFRCQNAASGEVQRARVLTLETEETYPHNSLLGITFSSSNWMYIARGNTGGRPYTLVGTDGSKVAGYGDGGSIFRCRPDGSEVQTYATGFWNPFDLKFDDAGRLLCVDNDPDSRGPNRLLHIVPAGDYGFRSLYGGSGLHPYQSWNGELPGTLPMIAGVGEAPSGLLDCSLTSLPEDYRGNVLTTIWGEHTIIRTQLRTRGVSLSGTNTIVVKGCQTFRPVAIAANSRGEIFFTDWVEREYPNHGHGRLWRLRSKTGTPGLMRPRNRFTQTADDPGAARLEKTRSLTKDDQIAAALANDDPFIRAAAVEAARQRPPRPDDPNPRVRLGALLALRENGRPPNIEQWRNWLDDESEEVRRMALVWIGERVLNSLTNDLARAVHKAPVSNTLLETYLATLQILTSGVEQLYAEHVRGFQIQRELPADLLDRLAFDNTSPAPLQRQLLARVSPASLALHRASLLDMARSGPIELRIAAVRSMGRSGETSFMSVLRDLARDQTAPARVRAEAIQYLMEPEPLRPLLSETEPELVQVATLRALRGRVAAGEVSGIEQSGLRVLEQARLALGQEEGQPKSLQEWEEILAEGGDPEFGELVFFAPASSCTQCHQVHGFGANVGPDLSYIARSSSRGQMLHSILRPSDDIAPQFQGWSVETKDGESHSGLQLHHKTGGAIELLGFDGRTTRFPARETTGYSAMTRSLMPDGLEKAMTTEDLRDLLAFLETLR